MNGAAPDRGDFFKGPLMLQYLSTTELTGPEQSQHLQCVLGKCPSCLMECLSAPGLLLALSCPSYSRLFKWGRPRCMSKGMDAVVPRLTKPTWARPAGWSGAGWESAPALCPGDWGDSWQEVWGLCAGSFLTSIHANQPLTFKKHFYCSWADFSLCSEDFVWQQSL